MRLRPNAKRLTSSLIAIAGGIGKMSDAEPDTFPWPEHGFTCFHCGETFTNDIGINAARHHFGAPEATPACILKGERALIVHIRDLEEQLARYRAEDSDTDRAMHRMSADHARALVDAEEAGYSRGVRDCRANMTPGLLGGLREMGNG